MRRGEDSKGCSDARLTVAAPKGKKGAGNKETGFPEQILFSFRLAWHCDANFAPTIAYYPGNCIKQLARMMKTRSRLYERIQFFVVMLYVLLVGVALWLHYESTALGSWRKALNRRLNVEGGLW